MSNPYISEYYSTDQIGISFNTGKYMYAFYNNKEVTDPTSAYISSIGRYRNLSYFMSGNPTIISGMDLENIIVEYKPVRTPAAIDNHYEIRMLSIKPSIGIF